MGPGRLCAGRFLDQALSASVEFVEDAFLFPEREADANRSYLFQCAAGWTEDFS